jgi:hypothetical protein
MKLLFSHSLGFIKMFIRNRKQQIYSQFLKPFFIQKINQNLSGIISKQLKKINPKLYKKILIYR